ncbi:MAG TPA: VCBS repeat-containing protein [Thermoanaerobaculia bacterium]|nr:VCBS repeat-containing protein [Thermoanaerobaculia bacterium]
MILAYVRARGWLQRHPLFLPLALAACTQTISTPPPLTPPVLPFCLPSITTESARFTAEPIETGLPQRGQWRDGFDLADMNGDGRLDLLHGPPRKGNFLPAIFLGDGRGAFARWTTAHFPPLPYDYGDIAAADFNGDGAMDIALSAHLRGLTVLIHEANGHYAPWSEGLVLARQGTTETAPFAARAIAVTDWNGDRRPDLLAINEGPSRLGLASPTPAAAEAFALYLNRAGFWDRIAGEPLRFFGASIATGDVNGDRRPDALLGTGVAGARRLLIFGARESWHSVRLETLRENAAVTATALHDVDRDRRDEIFVATRFHGDGGPCTTLELIRLPRDAAQTATILWSEASRNPIVALVFADFDGNLQDDLAALRRDGSLQLFAADGATFTRDARIEPPAAFAGCDAYDLAAADLDGDGRIELIASYAGETTSSGVRCASGGGFGAWRVNSPR